MTTSDVDRLDNKLEKLREHIDNKFDCMAALVYEMSGARKEARWLTGIAVTIALAALGIVVGK